MNGPYILVSALLLLGALFASRATLVLQAILIPGDGTRLAQLLKESRLRVLEGLFAKLLGQIRF